MKTIWVLILLWIFDLNAAQVGSIPDYFGNGDWVLDIDQDDEKIYLDHAIDFGGSSFTLGYIETAPNDYRYFIQSHISSGANNTAFGNGLGYVFLSGQLNAYTGEVTGDIAFTDQNTLVVAVGMGNFVNIHHFDIDGIEFDDKALYYNDLVNQFQGLVLVRDVLYIPNHNNFPKTLIVTEVEFNNLGETDFGVALYDMNPNSDITYNSAFGSRGRAMCAHDHSTYPNFIYSPDSPGSAVYAEQTQSIIVAGTAYEYDGRNQAFCEFNMNGQLQNKWSTQGFFLFETHQEWASATVLDESNPIPLLYVAGAITGNGELDYVIFRYKKNGSNQWVVDGTFGSGGYTSVGFNSPDNTLAAMDIASHLVRQRNGHFILGGTSTWNSNNNDLSHINLTQINTAGQLLNNWGLENGRIGLIWNTTSAAGYPKEQLGGLSLNPIEDIITTATFTGNSNSGPKRVGAIARLYNDPLFISSFD